MEDDLDGLGKSLLKLVKMTIALPVYQILNGTGNFCWSIHHRLRRIADAVMRWGYGHLPEWGGP